MKKLTLIIGFLCFSFLGFSQTTEKEKNREKAMDKAEKACVKEKMDKGDRGMVAKENCRREREIKSIENKQKDYIRDYPSGKK